MAKTYYGYTEKLADNQIDWGTIGKEISSAISKELVVRKATELGIEQDTRKITQDLANAPKGESQLENERISQFATNTTEYNLLQHKLWKSGQITTQQLTNGRQNLKDGIDGVFSLSKEYQAEYLKKKQRAEAEDPAQRSQMLEQWELGQLDGMYGSLANTQYYIDPNSGVVNLAIINRGKDGSISLGNSIMPINDARNRIKAEYNYWDSDKATTDLVDGLGTHKQDFRKVGSLYKAGEIRSISDIRLRTDLSEKDKAAGELFDKSLTDQINGFGAQWTNVTSYLTNDLKVDPKTGKAYTFTRNPEEESENVMLIKKDEMGRDYVDFTSENGKKQYAAFSQGLRDEVITKLDTSETIDTYEEPSPSFGGGGGGGGSRYKKKDTFGITVYENANNALRTGNLKNLDTSRAKFVFQGGKGEGSKNSILVYELDSDGDYVTYKDKDGKTKRRVKRIYSADQLAAYVKGVDPNKYVPTKIYNQGKDDWSKLHEGQYLPGIYNESNSTINPYGNSGGGGNQGGGSQTTDTSQWNEE